MLYTPTSMIYGVGGEGGNVLCKCLGRASKQSKVIVGVYIYIILIMFILYVCGQKKLNRTLTIDSPFQTFVVGLLVELID